jgi:hypothetical protein
MARTGPPKSDARAISQRLIGFAERRYGSWERFYLTLDFPRTTAGAWRGKSPRVPDPAALLRIARATNLNLNWLLLGEGEELRIDPPASETEADRVEAVIQAELRQSGGARSAEEFQGAWDAMRVLEDLTQLKRPDLVLHLAVEGVRPQFEEALRGVRTYAKFVRILNTLPAHAEDVGDKTKAANLRQLLREIGIPVLEMRVHEVDTGTST